MDDNTPSSPVQPQSSELSMDTMQRNVDNYNLSRLAARVTSSSPPSPSELPPSLHASSMVTQQAIHNHLMEIGSLLQAQSPHEGNTVLAIVKFPSDIGPNRACDGNRWKDMSLLMNYDKLMSLESSKIQAMFTPRAQTRMRRNNGLLILPQGVEYVLDFTPPTEGADLADLTAALWLPRMVKLWFLAGHYMPNSILARGLGSYSAANRALADKAVGACLALGHDDLCKHPSCILRYDEWEVKENTPGIFEDGDSQIPEFRNVEDYCPIRHRVSIMRVLRAINGSDLLLNSATRMWSVAQAAIHLEVPQVVVDPVTQWLIAAPNTKFIEICPEKAFQLAYALKIPSVLNTAFEILVSELAVDLAAPVPSPVRPARTWVGRQRDDYGDFPSDPVDYAARAFVERISSHVDILLSDTVFDRLDIREWRRLREIGNQIQSRPSTDLLKASYDLLVEALTAAFHRKVRDVMNAEIPINRRYVPLIEAQRDHYLPGANRTSIQALYRDLSPNQKALTPFPWRILADQDDFALTEHASHGGRSIFGISTDFRLHLKAELSSGRLILPGINDDNTIQAQDAQTQSVETFNPRLLGAEFNTQIFFSQLGAAVARISNQVLNPTREESIPLLLSDHLLLNLAEKELDFLPIWAGGIDDGTGGVFQEFVPEAELGPSEPGPGYHTGITIATDTSTLDGGPSTIAPSELGLSNLDIESVTQARSVVAERSDTTGPARNVVVAMGSSIDNSDKFSAANDLDWADAMYAQPASHQAHGRALADYVEDDGESTVPSFTVDGDTVSEAETTDQQQQQQQHPNSTITGSNNGNTTNDDFDMMDMEPEGDGELDFSSDDSESTLGGSDYDMI